MIGQHICSTATAETVYIDPEFQSNPQAEIPRQTPRSPSRLTPAVSLVLRDTLELSTQVIEKASVQASSCRCASLTLSTSLLLHFPYYIVLVRSHQLAKDNLSASLLRFQVLYLLVELLAPCGLQYIVSVSITITLLNTYTFLACRLSCCDLACEPYSPPLSPSTLSSCTSLIQHPCTNNSTLKVTPPYCLTYVSVYSLGTLLKDYTRFLLFGYWFTLDYQALAILVQFVINN